MTRKDYILLAEALRFARGHAFASRATADSASHELNGVMAAAEYIATSLKQDNRAFDPEHFLAMVRGDISLNTRVRGSKCIPSADR